MDFIPSKKEEKLVLKQAKEVINIVKSKINAEVVLGGSVAKGTWLPNPSDIDIFVRFDDDDRISELLKNSFPEASIIKGSRDYLQLKHKDYLFEIIPILKIKSSEQAKNITDVSPLHTIWVKKNSDNKLRNDIRKLKQFCKAQKVYGAESYLHGFSGYVLEILTINYGSFENLMKAVSKWKNPIIDVEKHHKNIEFELNSSKITPLIVIDPVQKGRNAAAAVSEEKLNFFINSAKKYLKGEKELFKEKKLKILKNSVVIELTPLDGRKDAAGCRLEKIFNHIIQKLEKLEFKIKKSGWEWTNTATMFFQFDDLKEIGEKIGPLKEMKEHAKKFREKYKGVVEKNGRLYVKFVRPIKNRDDVVNFIIDEYCIERAKNINIYKN